MKEEIFDEIIETFENEDIKTFFVVFLDLFQKGGVACGLQKMRTLRELRRLQQ